MRAYNNVSMKGRLYNYAVKEVEYNGKPALSGTITLEVDEDGTTVDVQYYANPTYNNGSPNKTYGILKDIYDGNKKAVTEYPDAADWLDLQGAVDVSYFVPKGQSATSIDDLVRAQKIRGSFINPNKLQKYNNKWKIDMIITKVEEVEADPERQLERYALVKGYILNDYFKRATEVQMDARSEAAINYLLNLDVSPENPYYVSTWGKIGQIKTVIEQKSAFGDDEVIEREMKRWILTSMAQEPYPIGDVMGITEEELKTAKEKLIEYKEQSLEKALEKAKESERQNLAF